MSYAAAAAARMLHNVAPVHLLTWPMQAVWFHANRHGVGISPESLACLRQGANVTSLNSIAFRHSSQFTGRGCHCRVANRIVKKEAQIAKQEISVQVKEDLKTVALGTSKINYLDPRISVAWCKTHEVQLSRWSYCMADRLAFSFLWLHHLFGGAQQCPSSCRRQHAASGLCREHA